MSFNIFSNSNLHRSFNFSNLRYNFTTPVIRAKAIYHNHINDFIYEIINLLYSNLIISNTDIIVVKIQKWMKPFIVDKFYTKIGCNHDDIILAFSTNSDSLNVSWSIKTMSQITQTCDIVTNLIQSIVDNGDDQSSIDFNPCLTWQVPFIKYLYLSQNYWPKDSIDFLIADNNSLMVSIDVNKILDVDIDADIDANIDADIDSIIPSNINTTETNTTETVTTETNTTETNTADSSSIMTGPITVGGGIGGPITVGGGIGGIGGYCSGNLLKKPSIDPISTKTGKFVIRSGNPVEETKRANVIAHTDIGASINPVSKIDISNAYNESFNSYESYDYTPSFTNFPESFNSITYKGFGIPSFISQHEHDLKTDSEIENFDSW